MENLWEPNENLWDFSSKVTGRLWFPRGRCIYHWELLTAFDGHAAGDFVTLLDAKATDCRDEEWQTMHIVSILVATLSATRRISQ